MHSWLVMRITPIIVLSSVLSATALANTVVPPGYTDTAISAINSSASNAYGGLVDTSGNVYVTVPFQSKVEQISLTSNSSQLFGSGSGDALSLALKGNTLFEGMTGGNIYTSNISTLPASATYLGNAGGNDALSLAIAPTDFGAYGGDLIVGGVGGIFAMNTTTGVSTTLTTSPTYVDGLAFGSNGDLYATTYNSGTLDEISATGGVTVLASGLNSPGAIAVQQTTGNIFVASENLGDLTEYSSTGTSLGVFASGISWDGGYWPSMLDFSADGTGLFYAETPSDAPSGGVHEITGFTGASAVPDGTSTMAMLLLSLAGCAAGLAWSSRLRLVAR